MFEEEKRPVAELFTRLLDDGRAYAKAEFDLARVKTEEAASDYKRAAILAGAGAAFGTAAVICLCLTLVLAFAKYLGPIAGGIVATLLVGAISGGLLFWAAREFNEAKDNFGDSEDDEDE
jgi:hypothetical protein